MPTDFAFRFSTYLTLMLACACTGYAEWEYLPEVSFFTGIVAALMVAAFVCDRRGWVMSLQNANVLGGGIFLLAALWFGMHYRRADSLMNVLPWPAGGLPYMAALMMLLVPAKLFRPKHVGDWWALHGLGLAMVGVAGAMTDDVGFMVLLTAYAVAGVWSLTLFYVRRSAGHVPPPPPFEPVEGLRAIFSPQTYLPRWFFVARSRPTVAEPFAGVGKPTPTERLGRSHLVRALRWVAIGGVLTLPLFLVSPRSQGLRWELFNSRMETGLSPTGVDLSRTGELHANPEPAFKVFVTRPDGSPAAIPEDKRFRVRAHCTYNYPKGLWNPSALGPLFVMASGSSRVVPDRRFPDIGSDPIYLEFLLEAKTFGTPMADPVYHAADQPAPMIYVKGGGYAHAEGFKNGSFRVVLDSTHREQPRQYWQISRAVPDQPSAYHRLNVDDPQVHGSRNTLVEVASSRIAAEAKKLLDRLIRAGKLPAAVRDRMDPVKLLPHPDDHLAVAAAFEQHFAFSGEYEYTLNLRRQNRTIDPVEDFLFNTKAGHCERFASGLVLMLRGVGVPCQFVIGYRGCEQLQEGEYQVRQDHAHAWVEVLVSRPARDGDGREWYWQTLDPTAPSIDEAVAAGEADTAGKQGSRLISMFITGLTPETQKQLWEDAQEFGKRNGPWVVAFGVALLGGIVLVGRVRNRRRPPVPAAAAAAVDPVPWYTRLVEVLTARGLPLTAGQTPAEVAAAAAAWLRARPGAEAVADVPGRVADALDAHRYANRAFTAEDAARVSADLDRLAAALK
jgi:hypothetical protein